MSNHLNKVFFFMLLLALLFPIMASAQTMTNIPITEISPWAVGVNPVTSKVYVANHYRWVTVINGTTPIPVQLGMGGRAVGVNPVTNKIYIANQSSDNVTVIDDASNTSTTVQDKDPTTPAKAPYAVAVNVVTNKVYIANHGSNTVTVIDGVTNATTSIPVGSAPWAIAVNPVTNKVYVANNGSSNVTVIDGSGTNPPRNITVGPNPQGVALNPYTNKIYVTSFANGTVTEINGSTDAVEKPAISVGANPTALAVNPVTNKIYVVTTYSYGTVSVMDGVKFTRIATVNISAVSTSVPISVTVNPVTNIIYVTNNSSNTVDLIDGGSDTLLPRVTVGWNPAAVALNMLTSEAFVANSNLVSIANGDSVTLITETTIPTSPLVTTIPPFLGNTTSSVTPTFAMSATSTTGSPVRNVYYQVDSIQGVWQAATSSGGSYSATTATLPLGTHTMYAYATDGCDSTSINTGSQSSPLIGAIVSYTFTVTVPTPVTYTVTPFNTAHGSIAPFTPQSVIYNQTTSFTVKPDNGYMVESVTGCSGAITTPVTLPVASSVSYVTGFVTSNCDVTATFSPNLLPVRIGAAYYLDIPAAFAKALPGETIQATTGAPYSGALNIGSAVTLQGGFDAIYSPTRTGNTAVGSLTITTGSLIADQVTIQ